MDGPHLTRTVVGWLLPSLFHRYAKRLQASGVRAIADLREDKTPPWKYNHYELKGVPIRLEVGPRDLEQSQVFAARRDTGAKTALSTADLEVNVAALLEEIQAQMFAAAKAKSDAGIVEVTEWAELVPVLNQKKLLRVPFCGAKACEGMIKDDSTRVGFRILSMDLCRCRCSKIDTSLRVFCLFVLG